MTGQMNHIFDARPEEVEPQKTSGERDFTSGKNADVLELYKDHWANLSNYLRHAFGDGPPDPDDIAQEAFEKVLEYGALSEIRNLKAFVWRTARNLVLSEKRHLKTRSKFDFEVEQLFFATRGPDSDPERVLEVREQLEIIQAVLKKMPERRRKAFLWHRMDGLPFTAIGNRLGINRRSAAKHVVRASIQLEAALRAAIEL